MYIRTEQNELILTTTYRFSG